MYRDEGKDFCSEGCQRHPAERRGKHRTRPDLQGPPGPHTGRAAGALTPMPTTKASRGERRHGRRTRGVPRRTSLGKNALGVRKTGEWRLPACPRRATDAQSLAGSCRIHMSPDFAGGPDCDGPGPHVLECGPGAADGLFLLDSPDFSKIGLCKKLLSFLNLGRNSGTTSSVTASLPKR